VQLQQVAQEGGGKYIDAQSEHELASALRQAVNMAQAIALAAPTPTLVPGAATPTPAGPTNTPRPTNTSGPTSTPLPPTKTPTPTVTLTPHAYPKPVAKGPAGGSEFGQFTAPIPLEWEWDSMLGSDEYFDIVIWRAGHEDENVGTWAHCGATAPSITMQKWEICEKTEVGTWRWFFRPPSMGTYTWKVRVVRGILDGKQRRAVAYLTEDSGSTTFQVLPPTPTFTPTPLPTATETSTPYPTNTPHP
jgi:hypothetical protein